MEDTHTAGYTVSLQCSTNHIFRRNYYLKLPVLYNKVFQISSSFILLVQTTLRFQNQLWLFLGRLRLCS